MRHGQADDPLAGGLPPVLVESLAGRSGDPRTPGGPVDGDTWLARLPRTVGELLSAWELRPDGAPMAGTLALVLPVRTADGEASVLKVAWPDPSTAHEHLALRVWGDEHAVRLLRADPGRYVQLLERAEATDLNSMDVEEACAVVGELLARLQAPARPPFPKLSEQAAGWAHALRTATDMDAAFPQRFRLQAASLAADLAADCDDSLVVHMDLHYDNVLASARGRGPAWLAIDPDPVLGEPEACPAPLLWNRVDPRDGGAALSWDIHNRIDIVSEAAGLDAERVRAWSLVRVVESTLDEVRHPTGNPHRDLALRVRLAKALQRR